MTAGQKRSCVAIKPWKKSDMYWAALVRFLKLSFFVVNCADHLFGPVTQEVAIILLQQLIPFIFLPPYHRPLRREFSLYYKFLRARRKGSALKVLLKQGPLGWGYFFKHPAI